MPIDNRLHCIVWTINSVLCANMCLQVFRWDRQITTSTKNQFHPLVYHTINLAQVHIIYNQWNLWDIVPMQSTGVSSIQLISSDSLNSDPSESVSSDDISLLVDSSSIDRNSPLHSFVCLCNDTGCLKIFPQLQLNMLSASRLISATFPFRNLTLTDDWWSRLTWLFNAARLWKKQLHTVQESNTSAIFKNVSALRDFLCVCEKFSPHI